ncbi:MAG: hypothetical protein BMS9Abin29_0295 [Gemmatimonadota bacterium]|nr:MAG: hypothetical protein BMS9Abin29_0295 [Gemmatimonadota bacterium]
MALIGIFSRNPALRNQIRGALAPLHGVVDASTWDVFLRTVRERPVGGLLVHLDEEGRGGRWTIAPLLEVRRRFPSVGLIPVLDDTRNPQVLFELGKAGFEHLVLMSVGGLEWELRRWVARAGLLGVPATVLRALSSFVPPREMGAVKTAVDGVHKCWSAEEFSEVVGLSRPFLSERFKRCGLPSVGHFLVWVRLMHAAQWLPDPGRTGQSVSRQLQYSSGAAFRRALQNYVGNTPTQVAERGGLSYVLGRFMTACGFGRRWPIGGPGAA